jgi:hypothetical protein
VQPGDERIVTLLGRVRDKGFYDAVRLYEVRRRIEHVYRVAPMVAS